MGNLLILALLAAPGVEVRAKPLSGPEIEGTLVRLSAESLVVKTSAGEKSVDVKQLVSVVRAERLEGSEKVKATVQLIDGSELLASRYTVSENKAAVALLGGGEVEVPTRSIRWVRLNAPDPALDRQWQEIVESKAGGDTLIVRKVSTVKVEDGDKVSEKVQTALDSLEGLLKDVTPDVVRFVFDGDALDVRREKIEGFVYYHAVERELPEPACRVSDSLGTRWSARSAVLSGEQLEITSVAGVKASLPLARFGQLDFSAGNTVFLGDLKPDLAEFRHPLDDSVSAGKLAKFYQPRENRGLESDSVLRVDGVPYARGLALQCRTQLAYRLPPKMQWFEALAGLDDSAGDLCQVRLTISGDNKPLFSEILSGSDKVREIRVDVSGVRRLGILVDVVNDRVSSQLNLLDARITK